MNKNEFDIIIIGAGIAGLYAAHKIIKLAPDTSFVVLEKQSKKYVGGRTGNDTFKGANIVTGAGVGRKKKDKLLIELLNEMNIESTEFAAGNSYASTITKPCKLKEQFLKIKREHIDTNEPQTFKTFATNILGKAEYNNFVTCSAYSDYENEDVIDTLYHYGFDDNYTNWTGLYIPWHELVHKLIQEIGERNVKMNNEVKIISRVGETFKITTESGEYLCKKIVFATTIDAVLKLFPGRKDIYKQIKGQPFLRTYGKFSKSSTDLMKTIVPTTTVVPGPLQRIIPINPDSGIYMLAYCDNKNAKTLNLIKGDTEESRSQYCRILEKSLGIESNSLSLLAIKKYFWPIGTHYYTPLSEDYKNRKEFIHVAQRPEQNIRVIGEMISENQGWVEGALESVNAAITKKWIKE
jgi:hypothetical protein